MNSKYVCFDDIIEGSRVYVNLFDKEIKITHSNDKLLGEKLGDYTVADYLRVQRSSNHKAIIGVVTTYNCNLRCSYCYEKGYQKKMACNAKELMTTDVVVASPKATVEQIAGIMVSEHLKLIPVIDDNRLVGLVTRRHILNELYKEYNG